MAVDLVDALVRLANAMANDRQAAQNQAAQLLTAMDQQTQQTAALVTALNALPAAAPAAGAGGPAAAVMPRISATAVESIPRFEGGLKDFPQDFVEMVERVAVAENWTDAQRIQVAARRLLKTALDWHIHAGHAFANWGDWSNAFIANFSPRLNFSEWHRLVEERRQKIGESGIEYALDKQKLLRVSPIPLNNEQMVSFLIDGLAKWQHVAAMTADIPEDVTEFIQRIRTLETLGVASRADTFPPPPGPAGPPVIPATPPTQDFAAALSTFGDKLVNQIAAQFNKLSIGSRGAGRGESSSDASGGAGHERGMGRNGRGGGGWVEPSARKCYNCGVVGHISRHCPSRTGKGSTGS
ncbi:uncharacterized protein LOC123470003 [Daphnia magna]|nr:uncharacterized protein LOC123470003 [Daphnia magna]